MLQPSSYYFRSLDDSAFPFATLSSIGWDKKDTAKYDIDVSARTDKGHFIFQYTLSGCGKLIIDGIAHPLPAGTGFVVKVPSDHRYYCDPGSTAPWEFIWLNVKGEDALRFADRILGDRGPLFRLRPNGSPLRLYWNLYREISNGHLRNPYRISTMVYEWIVSMAALEKEGERGRGREVPALESAVRHIKESYASPVTLDDIAKQACVSKYYVCRLFQKHLGCSPIEYVNRRRLEAAAAALRNTDLTVSRIAADCGFDTHSYFGKLFRAYFGLSPQEYRAKEIEYPYETIIIE